MFGFDDWWIMLLQYSVTPIQPQHFRWSTENKVCHADDGRWFANSQQSVGNGITAEKVLILT